LLACANVGNLMLARATARRREIAVRLAMGASRRRVVRQLLTESLVLATTGGALGFSIALLFPGWLMTRINGPLSWTFEPGTGVIAAAAALVGITCVAFGLAPALHATRAEVSAVLKTGEEAIGRAGSGASLRGVLLAVQIAISLLLLVNSGMLIRGIQRGRDQDLGFASKGVALLTFDLPPSYVPARSWAFTRDLMDGARASGGPTIGFASTAPLESVRHTRFRLPEDPARRERVAAVLDVSASYFDLLGVRILSGRNFVVADGDNAVLVNESMARDLWPGDNPLGKTVVEPTGERRVVGVVKDANLVMLDRIEHLLFRPIGARGVPVMLLRGSSPAIVQSITALAERLDSRAQVRVDSVTANVDRQLGGLRVVATLAGVLGVIALVLASIGVFGVFAFVVQQRKREIGIRSALGAAPAAVIAVVLRDAARSIAVGIGMGFIVAVAVGRLIQSALFGASALDPFVLLGTAVVLAFAGVIAAYVPARRATRIDPMAALRND
jgi:predicted permease